MMLNWGEMLQGEISPDEVKNGEILGHCPNDAPAFSGDLGHAKPNNGAASGANAPNAPNAPSENQGGECNLSEIGAVGAVSPSDLRADFSVSPSAVCLVFAWWQRAGGDESELASSLVELRCMPTAEQERSAAQLCAAAGLDPWRIVRHLSRGEGTECFNCAHLTTRVDSLPNTRRRYFWSCDLQYQLLEHHHDGERVVIAPPECRSWERWRPSR
jgi:hypothetical protein